MPTLERLFASMDLTVEEANKTVTKKSGGIRSVVKCNNKPIIVGELSSLRNRGRSINFNTQSKRRDCSYLFLQQHMQESLSSKINFIVTHLLKLLQTPELFNTVQSQTLKQLLSKLLKEDLIDFDSNREENLLSKWIKIDEKLSERVPQDGLVNLIYKLDNVCIEDEKMVQYYKKVKNIQDGDQCAFAYLSSYISVEFPIYELLKTEKNLLLGIKFEKHELEILKAIYQHIFQNIETKNAYSLLNKPLLNDKLPADGKAYIVDRLEENNTPTIMLIESFNSLATHIDSILDDITNINESPVLCQKFNLNLTHKEMESLKSYDEYSLPAYYSSNMDVVKEIESYHRIKFEDFNQQLNESALKSKNNTTAADTQSKVAKKHPKIGMSVSAYTSIQGVMSSAAFGISEFGNKLNILDPTDESFKLKIPDFERLRHTYIVAGSGAGKTSLIDTLLYNDCQNQDQSLIVFDMMGKATKSILKYVKDPSRIIYIDPHLHPSITPVINPFELNDKDELSIENRTKAIINAFDIALNLEGGWSTNMKAVLAPCTSTLLGKGDSDIYELQKCMNDEVNEDLVELGQNSPIRGHRSFFQQEFYKESYEITKNAISAKLQVFLNDPTFANLVTGKSTIDLKKEVNTKGKIIIFKLSGRNKIFARLMMEMIQDIMRERINLAENDIVPTHLYLDEFQNYLTPTIEEVLSESRNYKFYVTFAHQSLAQLTPKMREIVLSNSNIKIVGQCSYDNGQKMSKEMKADFKQIQALKQGEFIFKIGANDAVQWKNTDRFIKDQTPYPNKQKNRHLRHQYKKYYVLKDHLQYQNAPEPASKALVPLHDEF